jgi:hypothetical protein
MRKDWRSYTALVLLWLTEVVAAVFAWLLPPPARYVFLAILLVFPPLMATAASWDLLRLRRLLASAKTDADAAAETATLAHTRALDALRESMTGAVNATIVEIVAAQQAVVRAAHPDDVLHRLTAAEDSAHAALTATVPPILEAAGREVPKIDAVAGQSR